MRKGKGFTFMEIMIVVAIIAVLSAIAIPNLLQSRIAALESNAIACLRTIAVGAETFRSVQMTYPASVTALATAVPPYISGFTGGADPLTKSGYNFSLDNDTATTFTAIALPVTPGSTGNRRFCIDETGVMWSATAAFSNLAACAGQGLPGQTQID